MLTNTQTKRAVLWTTIALYTVLLPYAIFIYRGICEYFSIDTAGNVPIIFIILIGLTYILIIIKKSNFQKHIIYLTPCIVIVSSILYLEPNSNKHIHIPEYMLMSLLVYNALKIDYKGSGILFLSFLYSTAFGILDEMEQGIHINRFYGWTDMIINSASSLTGVLFVAGFIKKEKINLSWTKELKKHTLSIIIIFLGIIGAIFSCLYLSDVQSAKNFHGACQKWILIFNGSFILLALWRLIVIIHYIHDKNAIDNEYILKNIEIKFSYEITTFLWIIPSLIILLFLHAIPVYIAISGDEFR